MLGEFFLTDTDDVPVLVEHDSPARRGALVDSKDEAVHGFLLSLMQFNTASFRIWRMGCKALNDLSK
jgi:hypothetical protein